MSRSSGTIIAPPSKKAMIAIVVILSLSAALAFSSGCAPRSASGDSKSAKSSTMTVDFTWTEGSNCSVCHTVQADSFADSQCVASQHAESDCLVCHVDAEALSSLHEGVSTDSKMTKRLQSTEVSDEICFGCHAGREQLTEQTAACTVFTDNNGTVVNPHAMPNNSDHDSFTCASCHDMHVASSAEDYQQKCIGCHHAGVYECGTCH